MTGLGCFRNCSVTGQPHPVITDPNDDESAYGYEINRVEFDGDGFLAELDRDEFCRNYVSLEGIKLLWEAPTMRDMLQEVEALLTKLAAEQKLRYGDNRVSALADRVTNYLSAKLNVPKLAELDLFLEYKGVKVYYCAHGDMRAMYHYTVTPDNNDIDNPWPMDASWNSMFDVRDLPRLESEPGNDEEQHRIRIMAAIHFGLLTAKGFREMPTTVTRTNQPFDVYIGRANPRQGLAASKFANPFKIGELAANRFAAVEMYETYVRGRMATDPDFRQAVKDLRGKRLGCYCSPYLCHGHVLAKIAEEECA